MRPSNVYNLDLHKAYDQVFNLFMSTEEVFGSRGCIRDVPPTGGAASELAAVDEQLNF